MILRSNSSKLEADNFVAKHLKTFGVLGTNNFGAVITSYRGPWLKVGWSANDHYEFGYNGEIFNYRQDYGDFYWVNYAKNPETRKSYRESLREEIVRTVVDLYRKWGVFSVPAHGGILGELLIVAAREAGIPVHLVQTQIKEFDCGWPTYDHCKIEKVSTSLSELDEYCRSFSSTSECTDAEVIFHSFVGYKTDLPHIYESRIGLQFTDFNFLAGEMAAGPNWCLVDAEKATATARFLNHHGKFGCIDFFHYSPELMKAYLEDELFIRLVTQRDNKRRRTDNFMNHVEMIRRIFPELPGRNYHRVGSEKLSQWISEKSIQLESQFENGRDIWTTPLSAFGRLWGLSYECRDQGDEDYGIVF